MLLVPEETRKRLQIERDIELAKSGAAAAILRHAGLRPTRQRLALGKLLFRDEHCHVTADDLHRDAVDRGIQLSLATVYNTLNQFAEAGLVRKVAVNGGRNYFDTDAGDHHHFYIESEDRIFDVPENSIRFVALPPPPSGYEIAGVDVVIRLRKAELAAATSCGRKCTRCGQCAATLDLPPGIDPLLVKVSK